LHAAQDLLVSALRQAPRRYRLPPLPPDLASARAAGVETALAFAIEAARASVDAGQPAPDAARELFIAALAAFIRAALAPLGGDPAFQALVLQAEQPTVRAYARLTAQAAADQRSVRSLVDAIAHPGKIRKLPSGPERERLERLHALASASQWADLRAAVEDAPAAAATIRASAALQRLVERAALLDDTEVQRYLALCERRGPGAGSQAAAAQGRNAARAGDTAERITVEAFRQVVTLLQERTPDAQGARVVRSLRPPAGLPGERGKAKDEWDAAIVCGTELLLLAEVKTSPAAASSDFSRLHRGLNRLAHAGPERAHVFGSPDGPVRLAGTSLQRLLLAGRALPPHVIYCCTAPPERQPPFLAAASKAVLAAEPASLAYARRVAAGAGADDALLQPVWEALTHAPRLRATLHQDATTRLVRDAMLHPQDLVESVAALG
jgi:hypothetical protein